MTDNQNPEQIARDRIDRQLTSAGWKVRNSNAIDFKAGRGIAVREYQTDVGPADYVLFVDRQAVGVIEAKPEAWGHRITLRFHHRSAQPCARQGPEGVSQAHW